MAYESDHVLAFTQWRHLLWTAEYSNFHLMVLQRNTEVERVVDTTTNWRQNSLHEFSDNKELLYNFRTLTVIVF